MEKSPSTCLAITGVTRGLGRALCDWSVAKGHTVYGCGRSAEAVAELNAKYPAPHRFSVVDVSVDAEVTEWIAGCFASAEKPNRIVNNAALINENAPLWEVPSAEFTKLMKVNVSGVHHVIRAAVPRLIKAGGGVIVNVSSGWGRSVSPQVAPYCASKWAIEGLTQALAEELPDGLAAYAVNPGVIDTDMLRSCFGSSARASPSPKTWVTRAAPYILSLSPEQGPVSVTVP